MLKNILFLLLLIYAVNISGAPSDYSKELASKLEYFKDIKSEKLTSEEFGNLNKSAERLNVTLEDILLFLRLGTQTFLGFSEMEGSRGEEIFHQFKEEINVSSDPKEVTIEKLLRDHAKVFNELTTEANVTSDEILFLARLLALRKPGPEGDWHAIKNMLERMQYETTICPTPPEKVSEKPSSEEIQKYTRQIFSPEPNTGISYPLKMIHTFKQCCGVPSSVLDKLFGILKDVIELF